MRVNKLVPFDSPTSIHQLATPRTGRQNTHYGRCSGAPIYSILAYRHCFRSTHTASLFRQVVAEIYLAEG